MNPQRIGIANTLWNNCISFPLRGISRCCQTGITSCANRIRAKCPIIDKGLNVATIIVNQASVCCSPVIGRMTQLSYDVFWGQDGKNSKNISVVFHAVLISTVAALLFQQYGGILVEEMTGVTSLSDYVEMDVEYPFRAAISLLAGMTSAFYLKKYGSGEEGNVEEGRWKKTVSGLGEGLIQGALFGLIRLGVMKADDINVFDGNKSLSLMLSTYASLGYFNQFIGCNNIRTELLALALGSDHSGMVSFLESLTAISFICSYSNRSEPWKELPLALIKELPLAAIKGVVGTIILSIGELSTSHNPIELDLNYVAAIRGVFFGLVGSLIVLSRK